MPGLPAPGRLRDVVLWVLAAEVVTAAGAGLGKFGIWSGKMLAVALFLPGLAIGSGIQEAVAP